MPMQTLNCVYAQCTYNCLLNENVAVVRKSAKLKKCGLQWWCASSKKCFLWRAEELKSKKNRKRFLSTFLTLAMGWWIHSFALPFRKRVLLATIFNSEIYFFIVLSLWVHLTNTHSRLHIEHTQQNERFNIDFFSWQK